MQYYRLSFQKKHPYGTVTVQPGTTIHALIESLGINPQRVQLASLDGRFASFDTPPDHVKRILLMPSIGGEDPEASHGHQPPAHTPLCLNPKRKTQFHLPCCFFEHKGINPNDRILKTLFSWPIGSLGLKVSWIFKLKRGECFH